MNVWTFTGRIGRDAEQRFTSSGDSIVNFNVAVDSGFGDKKQTTWPRCTIFGKRGSSLVGYLTKGALVAVSGELTMREWEDSDGARRVSLEVRVAEVTLLGSKERASAPPAEPSANRPAPPDDDLGDDLPF